MNKDEFLAQVSQVVGRATDEEILRFDPALKPKLVRLENRRYELFEEICFQNADEKPAFGKRRTIEFAVDLLLFIDQKKQNTE